ncbi:TetR/AcrR family transcriptional regulator [Spirillospora sp. NPDC050679]
MSPETTTDAPTAVPPAPPSPKGRATRAAFEDAARRLIAERGFLRITVQDIAAAAGKSTAAFYRYFDNKEHLLAALADGFSHKVLLHSPDAPDGSAAFFDRAARAYWDAYKEHLGVLVGVFQLAMVDEEFAERWRRSRQIGVRIIEKTVRQAQDDGHAAGLDPALTASAIAAMFEHFCFVWLAQGGDGPGTAITDDQAVATLAALWRRGLYGEERP